MEYLTLLSKPSYTLQLIFSVFKTLTEQTVTGEPGFFVSERTTDTASTVELKNDLCLIGTLKSVDQFLNIKLDNVKVLDQQRYPHMVGTVPAIYSQSLTTPQMAIKNTFIRGSVVRYVQLPSESVDTQLLQDATRRESTRT